MTFVAIGALRIKSLMHLVGGRQVPPLHSAILILCDLRGDIVMC